jgi:hypothetical protein
MGRSKIPEHQKLAKALDALHKINGVEQGVIKGNQLKQADREILLKTGFLKEFFKGWYFLADPMADAGDTTPFFAHYFEFLSRYLSERFKQNYCLSAEHSLLLHAQTNVVPAQISVIVQGNVNQKVDLYGNYSLFIYSVKSSIAADLKKILGGVQCYSAAASLVSLNPKHFHSHGHDIQIVMNKIDDPSLIARLVEHNAQGVSRLVGAYRQIGRGDFADAILKQLSDSGIGLREIENPFAQQILVALHEIRKPLYSRVKLLWEIFRDDIIAVKPDIRPLSLSEAEYLASIEAIRVDDAYHSLSIERYRVTPELIQKIADGLWNPQAAEDKNQRDAMAAKGYLEAFNLVKQSANQAYLKQKTAAELFIEDHPRWFAQLFMPSVDAGLLSRHDLIGYRRQLVFLTGSKHVPPHFDHILDGLDALKECLLTEPDAFVNAVMAHFLVGYIHPFMDGNGRIARFTMNVMLAEGRYPWAIIPVELRNQYMLALEKASVEKDISPFAQFISDRIK